MTLNIKIAISVLLSIVNRGDWLWSPANIKGANKDAKIYVGRSMTLHNLMLLFVHTLCMNYVTNTLLLVSSSVRSKQLLCFVQDQGQKSDQKHTTKSFDEFHNYSSLLTMFCPNEKNYCTTSRTVNFLLLFSLEPFLESLLVANVFLREYAKTTNSHPTPLNETKPFWTKLLKNYFKTKHKTFLLLQTMNTGEASFL